MSSDADKIDLSPLQDGAILKVIRKEGQAGQKPCKGDTVHVHYVGTIHGSGEKFDSSRDRGKKFTFTVGKGDVIKGWELGVASMNKGEEALFTIKPEFAYGDAGAPPKIPGNTTLDFAIELFDFEGEDITKNKDKGVIRRILQAGEGLDHPNEGSMVELDIKAFLNDKVIDERSSLTFTLGEATEHNLPRGVDVALEKMKKHEHAQLTFGPQYGFGSAGNESLGVPGNTSIVYEVTLKSFERAKESWQLDGDQKLEQAKLFKEAGTKFFLENKFELASKKYKKIVEFLEHEISLQGDKEEERRSILQAGRLNLAMCHLKSHQWIEARNICDKVLEENPKVEKAYFRRGEALMHLNDHEVAKRNFEEVLKLDPSNKAAKNKITLCIAEIKKQKAKEKKTFANMFDRFAQIDAKREEEAKRNQKPLEINEWDNKHKKDAEKNSHETISVSGDVEMNLDLNDEMKSEEHASS